MSTDLFFTNALKDIIDLIELFTIDDATGIVDVASALLSQFDATVTTVEDKLGPTVS